MSTSVASEPLSTIIESGVDSGLSITAYFDGVAGGGGATKSTEIATASFSEESAASALEHKTCEPSSRVGPGIDPDPI
jgi:hypothetical protein